MRSFPGHGRVFRACAVSGLVALGAACAASAPAARPASSAAASAPPAPAAMAPAGPPRLRTAGDLHALCEGLSAKDDHGPTETVYVAELPAQGFAFRAYDDGERRLSLDPGTLVLDEGATLYAANAERALAFENVSAELAQKLADDRAAGRLSLRVFFRPTRSELRAEPCLRLGGGIVKMAVQPLAAQVVDASGAAVVRNETEEYAVATGVPVRGPAVEVRRPSSADKREVPEAVTKATASMAGALMPCYEQALGRRPALRGLLVVSVRLGGDGRVETAHPEMSTLDDEALSACVAAKLSSSKWPAPGQPLRLSLPIAFGATAD